MAYALGLSPANPLSGLQPVSLVLYLKLTGKAAFDLGEEEEAASVELPSSSISASV